MQEGKQKGKAGLTDKQVAEANIQVDRQGETADRQARRCASKEAGGRVGGQAGRHTAKQPVRSLSESIWWGWQST